MAVQLGPFSWERMIRAPLRVQERLIRATTALRNADIPYAIVGGNAVAIWVARVDPGAVRNTPDVNLLIHRADLHLALKAFESSELLLQGDSQECVFQDTRQGGKRDLLRLSIAVERNRPDELLPNPDVTESVDALDGLRVIEIDALVRMKLVGFRNKDQMHLLDLIDVGLVDNSWLERVPPALAPRLQQLLNDPNG